MSRRWALALGNLVIIGVLAALGTAVLARPVLAADPSPAPAAQGVDGLVPPPDGIRQGNQATLAERYPATSYESFPVDLGSIVKDALGGQQDPITGAANALFSAQAGVAMSALVTVAVLTTRLVQWSSSVDIVGGASGPVGQSTQALAQTVYGPLLLTAVVLVGGWLIWHLLVRGRTMQGLQGAGWSLGVMVAAGIYFQFAAQIMGTVNAFDSAAGQVVLSAIASGDPVMAARAGNPDYAQGDTSSAELRAFSDRYWRTFVYTPFMVATFGDLVSGQRYGEEYLAARTSNQDNSQFSRDFDATAPDSVKNWYHGGHGGDRLAIVVVALGIALLSGLLYLAIAGALVVSQFGLLVMLLLLPLFLLVGIHPGWGRRMLIRWFDLFVAVLLLRVLGSAVLGVVLVLSGLIASIPNWGVAAALQVALVLTAWFGRKRFLGLFSRMAAPIAEPISQSRTVHYAHKGWEWASAKVGKTTSARAIAAARAAGGMGAAE